MEDTTFRLSPLRLKRLATLYHMPEVSGEPLVHDNIQEDLDCVQNSSYRMSEKRGRIRIAIERPKGCEYWRLDSVKHMLSSKVNNNLANCDDP